MDKFQTFILIAPVLLFSMVAHEYAHGYAALKNGDPTAYQLGRLTWNPAKHIDPFLTIILPLLTFVTAGIAFGGAKPVPVNPRVLQSIRSYLCFDGGSHSPSPSKTKCHLILPLAR